MVRRTLSLPDSIDVLIKAAAAEGESYSGTAARLIERGVAAEGPTRPQYVASGEGPGDLGIRAEEYLRELTSSHR